MTFIGFLWYLTFFILFGIEFIPAMMGLFVTLFIVVLLLARFKPDWLDKMFS